jgi:hypothetical protein
MAAGYRVRMRGAANPNYRNAAERFCEGCGQRFETYNKRQRFCGVACVNASPVVRAKRAQIQRLRYERAPWPMDRCRPKPRPTKPVKHVPERTCARCGNRFSSVRHRRYCPFCSEDRRSCVVCGDMFVVHLSQVKRTCSTACSRIFLSRRQQGANSHRWRGGKTSETFLVRCSAPYDDWRRRVFTRDDYTCQMCGTRGKQLAAHHIRPFATHRDIALALWNGVTLCWPCHQSIKTKEADHEDRFFAITGGPQ